MLLTRRTGRRGASGPDAREARDLEQIHMVLGFRGPPIGTPEFYTSPVIWSHSAGINSSICSVPVPA